MKLRFNLLIAIIFACIAFSNAYALESKKLDMFDEGRGRNIPVVIYQGETINKPVVIISHGYGYQTLYGHMSRMVVHPGQRVNRGDIIGYVGNSGTSTGPHLHYEVHKGGNPVNPVNFYYNDLTPEEYEKMLELSSQANQSFD